jgi:aerobic-type carbon monoxide dehydrogenase small subunit (CoxS/CutS family)
MNRDAMHIEITVNGVRRAFAVAPAEMLSDTLRSAGYLSVKIGCGEGACGACTVLLDGRAVASCITFSAQAHGHEVSTVEALGTPAEPHVIQQEFVRAGAVQCGFCIPGMVLSAKALLDENPRPGEPEIRSAIDGNLCRCTGYVKQVEAIQAAALRLRGEEVAE